MWNTHIFVSYYIISSKDIKSVEDWNNVQEKKGDKIQLKMSVEFVIYEYNTNYNKYCGTYCIGYVLQ